MKTRVYNLGNPELRKCDGHPLTGRSSITAGLILLAVFGVTVLAGGQAAFGAESSDSITNAAEPAVGVDSADPATNAAAGPGAGLQFNFRNASMETVLSYLSRAAGFIIHPEVSLSGRVDVWSDQPVSQEDALRLVEHVLGDNGYAVIRDGRILTVISAAQAKQREIPVIKFTRLEDIPQNAESATYIIPVRTLNPVALVNTLRTLISPTMDLQANESANALLATDSSSNIRHLADIVTQLDSVSASINSLEVIPLKYADASALADLIKQLYPSPGASQTGGAQIGGFFGAPFGGGFGGGGGGAGGAAGGGGATDSSPGTRVTAVADGHSNSLIISAPESMLATIREFVRRLDLPTDDITEIQVFVLKHADATETASMLASLFPGASSSTDASQSPFQFGGAGGFGFGGAAATGTSTTPSPYAKKMGDVLAVPDPRTQSLVVSASKDVMPQIEEMVTELDNDPSGKTGTHVLTLNNAEVMDAMQILQDLYPQGQTSASQNNTQNNFLLSRQQTMQQRFNSSSGTTSTTSGTGTGTGTRTGN
jgi:general secretion pathway protein D